MGNQDIVFNGTPPIAAPRVVPVFAGKRWRTQWEWGNGLAIGIEKDLHPMMEGIFMKSLSDHYSVPGTEIGYGSVAPSIYLDQQPFAGTVLTDDQIKVVIINLDKNRTSEKTPGDFYMFYPEYGTSFDFQDGACGYHGFTNGTAYGVVPVPSPSCLRANSNKVLQSVKDAMVVISSHEGGEIVTDENSTGENSTGWKAPNGNEVGDKCDAKNRSFTLLQQFPNGTTFQQMWNPQTNSCEVLPGAKVPFPLYQGFIPTLATSVIVVEIGLAVNKICGNPFNKFILKPFGNAFQALYQEDLPAERRKYPPLDLEAGDLRLEEQRNFPLASARSSRHYRAETRVQKPWGTPLPGAEFPIELRELPPARMRNNSATTRRGEPPERLARVMDGSESARRPRARARHVRDQATVRPSSRTLVLNEYDGSRRAALAKDLDSWATDLRESKGVNIWRELASAEMCEHREIIENRRSLAARHGLGERSAPESSELQRPKPVGRPTGNLREISRGAMPAPRIGSSTLHKTQPFDRHGYR
jgi:hypothetical protein